MIMSSALSSSSFKFFLASPSRNRLPPSSRRCSSGKEASLTSVKCEVKENKGSFVVVGAVSVGLAMVLMGLDDHNKAMALGPEGPLMEEFWDNVRRYMLYALTVSTGALSTVVLPIYELLKNPISAVLVLLILGGSFFILTQVVSAMIGDTDFAYQYQY